MVIYDGESNIVILYKYYTNVESPPILIL